MKYSTFIINLDKNPERLSFMSEQFKNLGMNFERFNAINGSEYDFSTEYNEDVYKKINRGTTLTKGFLGCTLSHRKTLEKMIERNDDYVLVLEDDIELSIDFKKILENELSKRELGKTNWEYLSFNYPSVGWKSINLWLFLVINEIIKNRKKLKTWLKIPYLGIKFITISIIYTAEGLRENIFNLLNIGRPVKFYRPLYLAGCYLVTKQGAEKLVKMNSPIKYSSDGLPNYAKSVCSLKFYAYAPLVARQKREEFQSTLNNDHFGKKVISY